MKKLIIFVDALPFEKIDYFPNIINQLKVSKIRPSYGYSVNLHYLMFEGKYPDYVGFFGEYKFNLHSEVQKDGYEFRLHTEVQKDRNEFNSNCEVQKERHMLKSVDVFFEKTRMEFFRKVFRKLVLKIDDMIPYDRRKYFSKKGKYFFRELAKKGVYLGETYDVYLEELDSELPKEISKRILTLKDKLCNKVYKSNNVFLSFYTLDYYGHYYGTEANEYNEILKLYDKMLVDIIIEAKKNNYEKIILLSDHGMTTARKYVNLRKFENEFSRYFGKDIIYFYDSLYFQAKFLNDNGQELLKEIENYFKKLPGTKISNSERRLHGFGSNDFGDFIFVLNNGVAFSPNYFGYTKMRGYHGYAPGIKEQYGICAILSNDNFELDEEYSSLDLSKFINKYLKG
ncbi:type I phosphodiesterase / nucleotide pyrophosphatase [Clostridium tepidiprofundi DSM 19306]|uniref:Type I phosphodiesterase / nucleotide pyrophosphatase n=1 Tax=Clostridium tepidiprofundi DSM 19306 TaxID=1121338 RepID=A0A151AUJ6_9CLOT|nr:alkaline phosphatase family protein [Clostridium tepidiprofundi]KYH31220.1 type I phosphodiesterase / nucleotide pyrophosphatase [Clostridium tepidiprofundi DSM 19306]